MSPVTARVARQELVAGHGGVRSDAEVGERGDPPPAATAIRDEALPGQERRLVREGIACVSVRYDATAKVDTSTANETKRRLVVPNQPRMTMVPATMVREST